MAHRLISGASEKCSVPHGHNEFVQVKITKKDEVIMDHQVNMVEIFEKVKKTWHQFIDNHLDHALQVSHRDPLIDFFKKHEPEKLPRLVVTPGDPTTEIMCACLMSKLQAFLNLQDSQLICEEIKIVETPTNSVVLKGYLAYEKHLVIKGDYPEKGKKIPQYWWQRADFSVNDFEK